MSKYLYLLLLLAMASILFAQNVDLGCVGFNGPFYPHINTANTYTLRVRAYGEDSSTNYTIDVLQVGVNTPLQTVNGITMAPSELHDYTFTLTFTTLGDRQIYARINLTNDSDTSDNESERLQINVQPAYIDAVQFFDINAADSAQGYPFNYYYNNSVSQTIYLESELPESGVLTHIVYRFLGNSGNSIPPDVPVAIYLATTSANEFMYDTSWIPYGEFVQVFYGYLPVNGVTTTTNIEIPLQTPYAYGGGNLVVMTHKAWTDSYYTGFSWLNSVASGNRTIEKSQDETWLDISAIPVGNRTQNIPFTILVFAPSDDMSANIINGASYPTVNTATNYIVTVQNLGEDATSAYTVSLMREGSSTPLATQNGVSLAPDATQNFTFSWTPTDQNEFQIYGQVNATIDAFTTNNQTAKIIGRALPARKAAAQIFNPATETTYTNGEDGRCREFPLNYFYRNSVSQTIYLESELPHRGYITHLVYQFNFHSYDEGGSIPAGKVIKIYMGTTNATQFLSENSWIPTNNLTLVYDGALPVSNVFTTKNIEIALQNTFNYTGGNLVVMAYRPEDTSYYPNYYWTVSRVSEAFRSIFAQSDYAPWIDINSLPDAKSIALVPYTVFLFNTDGTGEEDLTDKPQVSSLSPNYPNPFNPSTTISFYNATAGNVQIEVYNAKGQKVKTLMNEILGIGTHQIEWNGTDTAGKNVSSGVYFYKMSANGYTETKKMLLMK